ncbi:murein hydrolase activator EnvC [Proteus mirabilis]
MAEKKDLQNTTHRTYRVFSLPLITLLISTSLFSATSAFANTLTDNRSQLKDLQTTIAEKEKRVQEQQKQRTTLLGQLKSQETQIANASRSVHETQNRLQTLAKEIKTITANIARLQKQYNEQQALLARQLDAAYRQGKHQGIELLFRGEEGQREERILAYYSYINEARKQSMEQLAQTSKELQAEKDAQQAKQNEQKQVLTKQQQEKQKLDNALAARQKTLTQLESTLKEDQRNLATMRANETRLRNKIAQAEREAKARAEREAREAARIAAKQREAQQRGSTYKPTAEERSLMSRTGGLGKPAGQAIWPIRGSLLHRFGESISGSGELRWKGIVIPAAQGTEVKAIADGRVLLADWLQGYGLVVVVEHGKGDMSLYGYNQSALVNVGQQVKAGQPIALVGNSGGQERSALYFEIRRQGKAVNPVPWLGR